MLVEVRRVQTLAAVLPNYSSSISTDRARMLCMRRRTWAAQSVVRLMIWATHSECVTNREISSI